MENTKRSRSTVHPADLWGTPEHAAWELKTYGPKPAQHPTGCSCSKCQAGYAWAKGYQEYIRRVHGR